MSVDLVHEHRPTLSGKPNAPISIHVVVERQLFVLEDIPLREYTHPDSVTDVPLGNITVWVAAVVGEAADASALGCVDELKTGVNARPGHNEGNRCTSSFCSIMK